MKPAIAVIVNADSGAGHDPDIAARLATLFARAGREAEIVLADGGGEIAAAVAAALARQSDIIVAGGGDGTLSSVGAALVDSTVALGVLPLGTLNHFAKDLGIPLDVEDAVEMIVHGRPQRIDVGEVNGHIFLNNSSLGLYPDIVRERVRQQRRLGRSKWVAAAWATLAALRRYTFLKVRLTVDGVESTRRTPFVFIGNNEYRMEGFAIGERAGLQDGRLSIYVAQRPGRLRLLQLALRALFGSLKQARDFQSLLGTDVVVESRHKRLRVATDGEITLMTPPLRYRTRPASLAVIAARPGADRSA